MIAMGDVAPNFSIDAVDGRRITLSDYADGYVLVAFLRYAGCPWCNLAVHRLAVEQPLLKDSKCEVVAFVQSASEDIESNILNRHKLVPKFPIIADPGMAVYKEYGVKPSVPRGLKHMISNVPSWLQSVYKEGYKQTAVDGSLFLAPATFLIAPGDQRVVNVDYDSDLYDHDTFTKVYDAMARHAIYG